MDQEEHIPRPMGLVVRRYGRRYIALLSGFFLLRPSQQALLGELLFGSVSLSIRPG